MKHLNLDHRIIKSARHKALYVAQDVMKFIDQHSTVSVERAILRMMGIDGVNGLDVPLVNVVIDHIKAEADLSLGATHYIEWALSEHNITPLELAQKIASCELTLSTYKAYPKCQTYDHVMPYIKSTMQHITQMKNHRSKQMEKDGKKNAPYLYVIVATGNIYEDIKQATSAAKQGADIIAVIRSTGQSLLDYVPYGPTTEGFGGTYATQANFKLMREALDQVSVEVNRYVRLVNYASGLCMPEIAAMGAIERLDMMLNDSLYGIIFRDINMQRTFIDQYFSRVLSAYAHITINTGEDNYLTTTDAYEHAHTVLASQFINEQFAHLAYMKDPFIGLGHAYEIDPNMENSFLYEFAQAQLSRQIFPKAPLKYMPPTKHITGDIFKATMVNTLFNIVSVTTHQEIHLLGMMTEAIHTPFLSDRALAIENALYMQRAFKDFGNEIVFKDNGLVQKRAKTVLNKANKLLEKIEKEGLFKTLERGRFADVKRSRTQGKGLDGVFMKHKDYANPVLDFMISALKEDTHG